MSQRTWELSKIEEELGNQRCQGRRKREGKGTDAGECLLPGRDSNAMEQGTGHGTQELLFEYCPFNKDSILVRV